MSRHDAALLAAGWEYVAPFGIPREEYDAGTVEHHDVVATITWTHRETGARVSLVGVFHSGGEILQCEYEMRPW